MLTEDKFTEFKKDYGVYHRTSVMDKYNHEDYVFPEQPSYTIHVMFHPIQDSSSIAVYGERINRMKECVYYGEEAVSEFDEVEIDGSMYSIVAVKSYNTHKVIQVELV